MAGAEDRAPTDGGHSEDPPETRVAAPVSSEVVPRSTNVTAHSTIITASDALEEEERTRTRLLGLSGFAVNVLGGLALPIFGGTAWSRRMFVAGLVLHAISNFGLFWVAGKPSRFTERALVVLWPASFLGLHLVMAFFGLLSVAAVAQVLGLYIVGISRYARVALLSYLTVALGSAVSVVLLMQGVIPDDGVVPLTHLSVPRILAMLLLLEAMFLAAFLISREARRRLADAVEQLREATRAVAQRDAVLEEARAEFRRIAQVGGRGRFSGVVLGSYRLENLLGRGGMGEIYEAVGPEGEQAAVKVLKQDALYDEGALTRFFRESHVMASIASPHVVRLLEVGGPPEDVPFIVMERLHGHDLASVVSKQPRLPVAEVARIVREAGRGLADGAKVGVTHRDVKQQNIFRIEPDDGEVRYKVLDFGVSTLSRGGGTLTQGLVVGTPGYMAPEQASGDPVDLRADLYGLGAVAYRCLVGQAPYRGSDNAALLLELVRRMPPQPSAVTPLDPAFDLVFAIALAKRPGDRFQSADALADALLAAERGELSETLRERATKLTARWPWGRPRGAAL